MALKKPVAVVGVMASVVVLRLDAADTQEKTVRFALTGTTSFGRAFDTELGGWLGRGARLDINWGQELVFTPEAIWIVGSRAAAVACSLSARFGRRVSIGAGPLVTWATYDRAAALAFKAQFGWTVRHYLFEFFVVLARSHQHGWADPPRRLGFTFGFTF